MYYIQSTNNISYYSSFAIIILFNISIIFVTLVFWCFIFWPISVAFAVNQDQYDTEVLNLSYDIKVIIFSFILMCRPNDFVLSLRI